MVKIKTSQKQEASLENTLQLKSNAIPFSPKKELLNKDLLGKALIECLSNNDSEGAIEILSIYINQLNKSKMAKKMDISRSTFYNNLKLKNPTLKTIAKIMHASTLDPKI